MPLSTSDKVKLAAAGAVLAVGAGAPIAEKVSEHREASQQQSEKEAFFSDPNVVKTVEQSKTLSADEVSKLGGIALVKFYEGDTLWDKARELGAENNSLAVDEMESQVGVPSVGDVVALPLDDLDPNKIMVDPHNQLPADSAFAGSGQGPDGSILPIENQTVTYVVPKQ